MKYFNKDGQLKKCLNRTNVGLKWAFLLCAASVVGCLNRTNVGLK